MNAFDTYDRWLEAPYQEQVEGPEEIVTYTAIISDAEKTFAELTRDSYKEAERAAQEWIEKNGPLCGFSEYLEFFIEENTEEVELSEDLPEYDDDDPRRYGRRI